jgi:hypothetical protein
MKRIKERDLKIEFVKNDNEVVAEATDLILTVSTVVNENPNLKYIIQMSGKDDKCTMAFTVEQFETFKKNFQEFIEANL